ncbi:hypothetical protein BACCELL_01266 [Bacteroides cellulosilyticus DSM 14838]|uniref:Uncharacterized protein n=1 Tax=Bacteroides cellulosilyticus DSM 14838 TaxID=537012 RepID=E2NAG1_9BACE|nr:hypothetical protein BACCELL_01266 [Bacteroides cellulosilyticus DSM 14838]
MLIAYKDKSFFSDNLPNRIFFCSPIEKNCLPEVFNSSDRQLV